MYKIFTTKKKINNNNKFTLFNKFEEWAKAIVFQYFKN